MPHLLSNMLIRGEGKKRGKRGRESEEGERERKREREGGGGELGRENVQAREPCTEIFSNLYQSGRLFRRTVGSKDLILSRIMCCECCLGQRKLCVEHVGKVKCQTTHLNYGVQTTAVYRVIPTVHTYPRCQDNRSANNKTRYLEE